MKIIDLYQKEAAFLEDKIALLPIGSVEVHGEHLPLGTDFFLAESLVEKLEDRLGAENTVVLPTVPYGQVWSLGNVQGSVNIPDDVLSLYLVHIANAVQQMGIKKLAVINTHVGNCTAIKTASRILFKDVDLKFYSFTYPGADSVIKEVCKAPVPHKGFFHACEIETSYMLYLCPEKVRMKEAICQYPDFPEDYDYISQRWADFMETAVLGDATQATKEKGKAIIDAVVERMVIILHADEVTK